MCEISAHIYTPEDGYFETVMVIHHGMAEHQKRYEEYIRFLCDHGIAVYMHDMANHGESNQDPELKGWFGRRGILNALSHLGLYCPSGDAPALSYQVPLVYRRDHYAVEVRPCLDEDIVEIDTFNELKAIDKTYDV